RTYAEEVYVQFVRPELRAGLGADDLVARAVAVSVPAVLLSIGIIFLAAHRWERSLPPLVSVSVSPRLFRLGRWRWAAWLGAVLAVVLVLGVPQASLVWRVGLVEQPRRWSMSAARFYIGNALKHEGQI